MTLREFLELPYTEDGKTCSAREHICHWVNSHVRAGWHEGGKKGRIGTLWFGTLAVCTPNHEITPEEVESCINIELSQFFTFGSRDDLKTVEDVMEVWKPTGYPRAAS